MICYQPPNIDSVPIMDAVNHLSIVDPTSAAVQAARALGISFGDRPATDSPFALPEETLDRVDAIEEQLEEALV